MPSSTTFREHPEMGTEVADDRVMLKEKMGTDIIQGISLSTYMFLERNNG
jgi:hypothetical protein